MENQSRTIVDISSKSIIRVILFGLLLIVLYYLRNLMLIILVSIVIASFVESGVMRFRKWGIKRTFAVILIYLFSMLVLAGIFYLFIPIFLEQLKELANLIAKYFPNAGEITNVGNAIGESSGIRSGSFSIENVITAITTFSEGASQGFFHTLSNLFGGIVNVILIFVISFYLSVEDRGIEKFLRIITPLRQEAYVISLWHRTRAKISRWVQGQMLLGLIVGVLAFIGLTILHVPYALILAIITAVLELIPFGTILATIPAVALAFAGGGTSAGLMTLGLFIVLQQIENYILVPIIVRRVTGVPPLIVILSLLSGVTLGGFWGLILAMPVAVFLLELLSDVEKKKFFEKEERDNA